MVTDHNQPVLKITPITAKTRVSELFGDIVGQVTYLEDINQQTISEWEDE